MICIPPIDDDEQNKSIKELDRKYQALWKDEVALNDGAHPRDKGYEILANFIHNWSGWVL